MVPIISGSESDENQLELFELGAAPRPRLRGLGGISVWLRYEQLILVGIAGLIGLTVVFAFGVERGKHLARAQKTIVAPVVNTDRTVIEKVGGSIKDAVVQSEPGAIPKDSQPARLGRPVEIYGPSQLAQDRSGYAIQLVTYQKSPLAQLELERLRTTGESAFLRISDSYTVLYVGPFPSKDVAQAKLPDLKVRYSDCFIRTL